MRLGLVGLGRIGEFHARTLAGIPAVDSLVVTDIRPDRMQRVVDGLGERSYREHRPVRRDEVRTS